MVDWFLDDKMLETLNGMKEIEKTYFNESHRLELRFRPDDVYSHSTFADRINCNNLLVKFRRRRKADGSYEYEADVVGLVNVCFQFRSLADFQYLPVTKTEGNNYRPIQEEIFSQNPFDGPKRSFNPNAPLFVLPAIFSRFDSPSDYFYRSDVNYRG